MQSVLRILNRIVWSLWFGGIIALFIFVQTLFARLPRETFITAAPHLFFAFERYQLALAAIALIVTGVEWLTQVKGARILFVLLTAATLLAVVETAVITPHIERLRMSAQISTPEFRRWHGISMGGYLIEAIVLLWAGFVLMQDRRSSEAAQQDQSLAEAD